LVQKRWRIKCNPGTGSKELIKSIGPKEPGIQHDFPNMNFFLDITGPLSFFTPLIILFASIILIEAIVMMVFKLNWVGKSLGDSVIVNIASILIIFLVLGILADFEVGAVDAPLFISAAGLYLFTFLGESLVLKLLNKNLRWGRIVSASAVMNLLTYILLYFFYISSFNP